MAEMEFKSPVGKLLSFFRRSRDRWKEKYFSVQERYRNLAKESGRVGRSRAHWREQTCELRQQVKELQAELAQLKR